jgi:hypothetical protein
MFVYSRSPREWIDNFFDEAHEKRERLKDVIKNITTYILNYMGCEMEDQVDL